MTIQDSTIPSGVYTPITTFFKLDDDYSLDLESQIEHAKFLYKNGINGLVVCGSMGEAFHLTSEERVTMVSALREAIPDKDFKIIAGAPPIGSVEQSVSECKAFYKAGADFVILLVPGFFGPNLITQEGIVQYFTRVADKSPLPVIIYNYPGVCNNITVSVDSFKELSKHENIAGVKLTHFNLDLYALLGQDKTICETNNFRPFTGLGQILVPALSVGIYGTIDGMSAVFPKTMLQLYKLFRDGKIKEASELQYLVTKADAMIMELNVVGVKHALKQIHGFGKSIYARPPLSREVDLKAYQKFEADLKALEKVEASLA